MTGFWDFLGRSVLDGAFLDHFLGAGKKDPIPGSVKQDAFQRQLNMMPGFRASRFEAADLLRILKKKPVVDALLAARGLLQPNAPSEPSPDFRMIHGLLCFDNEMLEEVAKAQDSAALQDVLAGNHFLLSTAEAESLFNTLKAGQVQPHFNAIYSNGWSTECATGLVPASDYHHPYAD